MPVLSYRTEMPRVSVYPRLTMPGQDVIIVARPLQAGMVCLRVIDSDAFVWDESCWEDGSYDRITFTPMKPGRYIAYLAYQRGDDGWVTTANDDADFCAVGEDAGCP